MIFLGAGASAPFGIKMSKELTMFMRKKIETINSNLLSDIDIFYKQKVGMEPDFEIMLTQLTAFTDKSQVDPNHPSVIFANMYSKYKDDYSQLINEIYNEVCRTCTAPFIQGTDKYLEPQKLEDIFTTTYDALIGMPLSRLSQKKAMLIFSTNYDPSIELWCQKRNIQCIDGTIRIENPEVKKVNDISQHILELNTLPHRLRIGVVGLKIIGLVRLHGSVWTYKRRSADEYFKFTRPNDRLLFPDLYEQMHTNHPFIIFPGQENYLRIGRWDEYYQFFKDQLQDVCLFIGYSFRHAVINEQIISNLATNKLKKLYVFAPDPDKILNNLFRGRKIPKDKIMKIKGYFGEPDSLRGLNEWFRRYHGRALPSPLDVLHRTKEWKKENRSVYL